MPLSAKEKLILIRVKVERAKEHLRELESEAGRFRETYTYAVGPKMNLQTGKRSIDRFNPVKVRIASFKSLAIAGDIIQNLRSSLDHLAYQLSVVGTPGVEPSEKVAFPICASAEIYESAKVRKVQGMRPEAVKAIDSLKPYKGGNDALWKLHKFNNIDKHHLLVTVGYDYLLQGTGFEGEFWLKADDPLFKGIFGPETDDDTQFSTDKSLGQTQVTEGDPLLPTLVQLVEFVDNLIGSFEPLLE